MKMQRVAYRINSGDPMRAGVAIVTEFDQNVKYIIDEYNGVTVLKEWDVAELDRGPLAYLDTTFNTVNTPTGGKPGR